MRESVLESVPDRRRCGDVVGVVEAPIGSGKNLLRISRVRDDGVDRNIGKVAGLVCPGEGGAVGRAGDLEDVTGSGRCVGIEAADAGVADRCGRRRRIESDIEDGAIRQDGVAAGDVDPDGLVRAGAKAASDLDVAVIGADDDGGLKRGFEGELGDEGAVA